MNLKNELIKVCIFMLLGAYLCTVFIKKDDKQPEITQKQEQKQDCKVVIKKVTNSDGSVSETAEFSASSEQKQEQKIETKKNVYGFGLKREYDFKNQYEQYEIEIMRDTELGFDIVFSYNSSNQAGIGIIKRF